MKSTRKSRYWLLRGIRKERDYESGKLQFEGRPFTKPSFTERWRNGQLENSVVTTNQFMKRSGYDDSSRDFEQAQTDFTRS